MLCPFDSAEVQDFVEAVSWRITAGGLSFYLPDGYNTQEVDRVCDGSWRIDEVMPNDILEVGLLCLSSETACVAVILVEQHQAESIKRAMRAAWGVAIHRFAADSGGGFLFFKRLQHDRLPTSADVDVALGWRLRWFRIKSSDGSARLESFSSPALVSSIPPRTYLVLDDASVSLLPLRPAVLSLKVPNKSYLIRAPSSLVAQAWLVYLLHAKDLQISSLNPNDVDLSMRWARAHGLPWIAGAQRGSRLKMKCSANLDLEIYPYPYADM